MWIFFSGYILTILFNHLIMKLHKNNFLNNKLFLFEKFLGWVFQEHIRQDYYVTTGKRFMLKKDFRNRFVTQSIKVIRNIILWIHVLNILELGTLIFSFIILIYVLLYQNFKYLKNKEIPFSINFVTFKMFKIVKYKDFFIILFFLFFFKCIILKTYSLFDLFFVLKPFVYLFIIVSNFINIFGFVYLIYLYLLIKLSSKLGGFLNIIFYKIFIYFIILFLLFHLMIIEIDFENFCKEIIFKVFFFYNKTSK